MMDGTLIENALASSIRAWLFVFKWIKQRNECAQEKPCK